MVYIQYDMEKGYHLVEKDNAAFECDVCSEYEPCNRFGKDCLLMWLRDHDEILAAISKDLGI